MNSFYSIDELNNIGFKKIGSNVLLSRKTSIYGASHISIGNNVRIDDYCILSGKITLSSNIHIATYCALYGGEAGICFEDYSGISSRGCVYAVSDDYSGLFLTNPMVPDEFKNVISKPVNIGRHVIIGSGVTILPGVNLADGSAIGAMSLCNKSTRPWGIYFGIPARRINERSKKVLELEKKYKASYQHFDVQ